MFGEEGKEKLIKTLRQQIADRDARYSQLLKEKTAQDETLKEKTEAVDSLRTKANNEESRADRTEAALKGTKDDLANAKLNVTNLETQLRTERARASESEREKGRLEYDLASLSHSGPGPSTVENKLNARVKALEQELQRKDAEVVRLTRTPPPTQRTQRKRRSSVGDLDLALTNQRDDATKAAAAAQREVASVKARLSATERERDQALNARLAAEKRAARETDSLQERVEELQYYLDQRGGSQPAAASEKARSERDTALARAEELEGKLKLKEGEVEETRNALEERAKGLEMLTAGASAAEQQVAELRDTVKELEAQLARAHGTHVEKADQIERERDAARAEIVSLQSRIEESTRNFQRSSAELEAERARYAALRGQVEVLERKAASTTEAEAVAAEARARVQQLEEEARASTSKLADAELSLSTAQETTSAAESVRDGLQTKLDAALADVTIKDARLSEMEAEIAISTGLKTQLISVRNESKRWRETAETYQTEIMEMETVLQEEISDLSQKLSIANEDLSRATWDRDAAQTAVKRLETEILTGSSPNDQDEIVRLREERDRLSAELQDKVLLLDARDVPSKEQVEKMTLTIRRLRSERDEFKGQVAFAEDERKFAERAITASHEKLNDAVAQVQQKDTLVSELEAKLVDHESWQGEGEALRSQINELQPNIAALEATISDFERQLAEAEEARAQLDETAALVDILGDEKAVLQSKIASLESKIETLEAEASANADGFRQERDGFMRRLNGTEGERDTAKSQLTALESQTADLRSKLDSATADLATETAARKAAENRAALQAAAGDGEAQSLLAKEQARVERRDNFIKLLEVDKQKLDFNLKSVQDDFSQLSEAHAAVEARLAAAVPQDTFDQLNRVHDALKTEHANLAHSLENARAQTTRLQETLESTHVDLESLTIAHARTLAEHKALKAEHVAVREELGEITEHTRHRSQEVIALVLAVAVHRQAVASAALHANNLGLQLRASTERVAALEDERTVRELAGTSALLEELEETKSGLRLAEEKLAALQVTSAELSTATERTASLQSRIADLESALAMSESAHGDATARTSALEEELTVAETARTELKIRAKELQIRVGDMQDDLDAARTVYDGATGRAVMLENDLANALKTLAVAEDRHARAIGDLRAQLDAAATKAEGKLTAAKNEAVQTKAADEQVIADLEAELTATHEQAGADLADAHDRIKAADEEVATLSETIDSLRADLEAVRDEHDTAAARAENAMSHADALAADVARMQSELEAGEELAKAAAERIELLVSDLSAARAQNSTLGSDLDAATADLQAVQCELDRQRTRESDLVAELDTARLDLGDAQDVLKEAQNRAAVAEADARKAASHLSFMERGQVDMSTRLATLRDELVQAQAAVAAAEGQARETERLANANKALKDTLADAEEDLKYKTASLDAKNLDLEEADDREMELKKQIKKAGARAEKLSRKVRVLESEIETLQNTMENMSPRRTREIPSIAITPSSSSAGARATAAALASAAESSLSSSAPSGPSTTPRAKRSREAEDELVTREVWVEDGPLPKRNSPPSEGRQPLAARTNRQARKPLTSTERAFMQKRAQMAASTPSERKVAMRSVLGSATTPGATPGDRRVFGPGGPGSGRSTSG
ncbi:hypothetical protein CcaverHIS002_0107980 [Cutaneotrichosporon cavernicola]|uniref:Uncharacterized protein n=1 Tax=Cutaneotrichosporon cavernicola TaxID=279322 RepID=A0AA48I569_9TREE|nr:uncharacterized protein CcaverHIS019_0107930 [Cutaneotrichosporon cavernicola]BEI80269.1 hypothetical protein CcaverHIS002_0107980 [Cutaneotrichosporon cavernicola]BEI88075.1 hypothetical protein CcaverHIS019_0107930 [Cutaneotrichosporon cavernicola]BEI95846.1 hypothetical protein CcaverHIS631_0107950 [Cutaneotrichosporon cavernicola]BEJ03620.1 hypothetical protein CcaverHIS641_0107950 [Cutaneotrichosporon cavernicola]